MRPRSAGPLLIAGKAPARLGAVVNEPYQPPAAEGLVQSSARGSVGHVAGPARGRPAATFDFCRDRSTVQLRPRVSRLAGRPGHWCGCGWYLSGSFFVAVAAWSFASPLGSGPDEPAHLVRAVSLVRGQLVGHDLPHPTKAQKSTVIVQVPEVFASLETHVGCFQYKSAVPAGCQQAVERVDPHRSRSKPTSAATRPSTTRW